jgi:hypothetical protein
MWKWWEDWMMKKQANEEKQARDAMKAADAFQAARENLCFAAWWEAYREALRAVGGRGLSPAVATEWAKEVAMQAEVHYRERSLRRDRYVADLYVTRGPRVITLEERDVIEDPTTLPVIPLLGKKKVGHGG